MKRTIRKTSSNKKSRKKNKRSIDVLENKPLDVIIKESSQPNIYNFHRNLLLKYLKTPFEKQNIHLPKNDYYSYINEKWFQYLSIDKSLNFLTKIDDFRVVQFNVYNELDEIIKEYIKSNGNTRLGIELKHFYTSASNYNSITNTKAHIKDTLAYLDKLREKKENIWELLAFVNKNEMINDISPLTWTFNPDRKNSKEYCNYLNPRTFAFFDISAYLKNAEKEPYEDSFKKKFYIYLKKLFGFIGDKSLNTTNVYEVEQTMLNALLSSDSSIIEDPMFYNRVSAEEALTKYGFDWREYTKHMGFSSTPNYFVTTSLNNLKSISKLLIDNWNTEKWRSYWVWILTRYCIRLTHGINKIFYEFYGKITQGMQHIVPRKILTTLYTMYAFNSLIHNEYINKFYVERNVTYCEHMANDIREVFKNIIRRNKWLQPKTKNYAIFKLDKITMNIRPVANEIGDPLLNYNPNDFLGNMLKVFEWRHQVFIKNDKSTMKSLLYLDFTKYPAGILSRPSYLVNAQYIADENSINIPLAYMQKPFLDLEERGIEYNLAYMGFTIAHELSHALDDFGSQFDHNGNLRDWWTNKDKKTYKRIQEDIINHYETIAKYDGEQFDAKLSVGEDIADISGLAICEDYLRNIHVKNKNIPIINRQSYSDFYIYFTYQFRQHIKRKSIQYEMIKNPHPLDKYRANVPLSRSIIFRTLHNIQKGDKMFWNNSANIW
jgi:putative endopeptidase